MKQILLPVAALFVLAVSSCNPKIARVSPNETIDLSGKWNDVDSRQVSEEMIGNCLGQVWLHEWTTKNKRPVVIVGKVVNKSHEHIATETFTKDMEKALLNSGKVDFVADKGERDQVRDERLDQQTNASAKTAKDMGEESGADYMLSGSINSIVDQEGKKAVIYYQVDLQLIHMESNKKVWIGDKKIKKYITKSNTKF